VILGTIISVFLFDFVLTAQFVWGAALVIFSAYLYGTPPSPLTPPPSHHHPHTTLTRPSHHLLTPPPHPTPSPQPLPGAQAARPCRATAHRKTAPPVPSDAGTASSIASPFWTASLTRTRHGARRVAPASSPLPALHAHTRARARTHIARLVCPHARAPARLHARTPARRP
jgi:hypothetical protein